MALGKRALRWKTAERLAQRRRAFAGRSPEATYEEIEEANLLVGRLCRLANDNMRRAERENDSRVMKNPQLAERQRKAAARWCEREKEIRGLFADYGCTVIWPGIYPSIVAAPGTPDEGADMDICEMY